ncbi:YifB family Mg chelatase-like AAA ATPase [Amnibacterium flavum]|uniref:Mg chelatase-like protein n=1 Tax=Amnibacterium flavum TaxID=2173173 RepID=A0A2V1HU38_9MICO|nr:YifB family Mg chelatase-like AAA ATPase [Amnibacterium flavum]PVZ96126.1 Mg chelatase-like protein [Amnibacterium flavum]
MTVGRTWAVALLGLDGSLIEVEAGLGTQTPGVRLIGLPDSALREAEHRVRAGIINSGLEFPARHVTVNLSPAELPKQGAGFDLAIAMATLVAEGSVPPESVARTAHLGELALDGRLRPLRGVLPAVLAAARAGVEVILVPSANADEASLVPDIRVVAVPDLREAAIWHGASLESLPTEPIPAGSRQAPPPMEYDLADVIGNEEAIDALIVAAAGGHHVYMVGPPGAGKTMLAARLPSILPPLDEQAALEVASLRSLAGLEVGDTLSPVPPFESPHHTATASAMIGGGSRVIRPGSAARASNGILFLDEAPEFGAKVLDTLRQPLESGRISVERATAVAHFPARFQLVLAANPCPCGHYGSRDALCACPPTLRDRYLKRISGPLLDRVDIRLMVPRITAAQLRMQSREPHATSSQARQRVLAARARASARLRGTPWRFSGEVPGHFLRGPDLRLDPRVTEPLDRALERGSLSMRGYDRTLRVAWTLSDLDAVDRPTLSQVGRALALRRGGV